MHPEHVGAASAATTLSRPKPLLHERRLLAFASAAGPRLKAPALNLTQDLYVSGGLKTGRVMVKDEDVCLHCGLCAERCPTGAWDMQKSLIEMSVAGPQARSPLKSSQKKAA